MADPRFFQKIEKLTLGEIARIGEVRLPDGADASRAFADVAGLETADAHAVSWAFIAKVRDALSQTKAGAVIVPEKFLSFVPAGCIPLVSADPHRSYGLVAQAFYPRRPAPVISDKAIIDPSAKIGDGCRIDAGAVIEANAEIGAGSHICANAVVGEGVVLGARCIVGATASVSHCIAGDKVYIYPGAHVGQDGFGFAMSPRHGPTKVPQLGRVVLGDDVEIGSCTTIDRGAMGDTIVGSGTRIDNLVQVAHNVRLGKCNIMVSQVGIAGSCAFGDFVTAGGQVGFAGHLKIGAGATIGAQSGLMSDVPPGATLMGSPAVPAKDYMRQVLAVQSLGRKKDGTPAVSWKMRALELIRKYKKKGNG